jgi:type II secretory pathway pseudopilin PulG
MTTTRTPLRSDARGFSLVELMISMGITMVIMGATMTVLADAARATDTARLVTTTNTGLRVAMDMLVRDLLQAGQGLPTGRSITIPSGAGVTTIRMPGPPGTTPAVYTVPAGTTELNAVIPAPGRGPAVNNVPTDMIWILAADSSFENRALNALTDNSMRVALNRPRVPATANPVTQEAISNGANITDGGEDDIEAGDLIMLTRGSVSALVQVTSVTAATNTINFAGGDSLGLNQTAAADGTVREYRDVDAGAAVQNEAVDALTGKILSTATRIRMISYYIDATTDPQHPRLIRRMNNGHPTSFSNTLGTAVAFDIENLQFTFDLADGDVNPTGIRMTAADIAVGGACGSVVCDLERIRKVNVLLAARARQPARSTRQLFRTSLLTQVSLRSLAFVDRYE